MGNEQVHAYSSHMYGKIHPNSNILNWIFSADICTNKFRCNNSMCIYKHQVCDLTNNCGDFSDEENCDYMKGNVYYKSIGSLLRGHLMNAILGLIYLRHR